MCCWQPSERSGEERGWMEGEVSCRSSESMSKVKRPLVRGRVLRVSDCDLVCAEPIAALSRRASTARRERARAGPGMRGAHLRAPLPGATPLPARVQAPEIRKGATPRSMAPAAGAAKSEAAAASDGVAAAAAAAAPPPPAAAIDDSVIPVATRADGLGAPPRGAARCTQPVTSSIYSSTCAHLSPPSRPALCHRRVPEARRPSRRARPARVALRRGR
jgi:hypothetical protein